MKPNIIVIGSSNTDLIIKLPRFPKPGETVLGGEFAIAQGGKGANQAVAAARAGAHVSFVSSVGDDLFGTRAVEAYRAEGIDTQHVVVHKNSATGVAMIFVDGNGENSIGVASGANLLLEHDRAESAGAALGSRELVLLQLEIPIAAVEAAIRAAHHHHKTIILNPAPAQPLSDDLLKLVTVLTPNETETELLTGIPLSSDDAIRSAAEFLRRKGIDVVIITLGKRGVFVSSEEVTEFIAGFAVEAVDTTAAGDVFNGAMAAALAEHRSLREALRFANAAAALSVTRLGAQPSAPSRAEIDVFLTLH